MPQDETSDKRTARKAPSGKKRAKGGLKDRRAVSKLPRQGKYAAERPDPDKAAPGPPRKEIDWAKVEELAEMHCTVSEIAAAVGISESGLRHRKEFFEIYQRGFEKGNVSLRSWQFAAARAGDKTMLVWLGKQYLGQTDKAQVDQNTTVRTGSADLSKLSIQEMRKLRELLKKAGSEVVLDGLSDPKELPSPEIKETINIAAVGSEDIPLEGD